MNHKHCDAVGIGFGPSNLSIAVAYDALKSKGGTPLKIRFLEKNEDFDWHPGMLIDNSTMQVSFLKDMITSLDPTSRFTFLNYLRETGGLDEFINLRTFFPPRLEYRNYLRWVAKNFSGLVQYNSEVIEVSPNISGDEIEQFVVKVENKELNTIQTLSTRSIIMGCGGRPKMPSGCVASFSNRIIHSSSFLSSIRERFGDLQKEYRFAVIGSGQSAAEMFQHLYTTYPNSIVSLITSGIGFKPADDSAFVNELFYNSFVDEYYSAEAQFRYSFLDRHSDTNYAAVDPDLISAIAADIYADRRFGGNRISHIRFSRVLNLTERDEVRITTKNQVNGQVEDRLFDAAFLGTGYSFDSSLGYLENIKDRIVRDAEGQPVINRDYSLRTRGVNAKIYLMGPTEHTHGLSSTLLSIMPQRAKEVLDSISDVSSSVKGESNLFGQTERFAAREPSKQRKKKIEAPGCLVSDTIGIK